MKNATETNENQNGSPVADSTENATMTTWNEESYKHIHGDSLDTMLAEEAAHSEAEANAKAEALKVIEAQALGEEADAGFDGGEFSGPAHAEILDDLLCGICLKHNISRHRLDEMLNSQISHAA